jgi:hypothetical protein
MTISRLIFQFESWIPACAGMTKKGGKTGVETFFRRLCLVSSFFLILTVLLLSVAGPLYALDTDVTRKTLSGLQGVYVAVEELQPNLMKYGAAQKVGLSKEALQRELEARLTKAGIRVLTWDQMLKTPGSPFLYVVVNTHESEKYWYAYDIRIEFQQLVIMEANPKVRAMAGTWSINMTGIANIGTLQVIKDDVGALVGKFVQAYRAVNKKQ